MNADQFQASLSRFIRAFGLHQPSKTPCGQSMTVSEAHALTSLSTDQAPTQNEISSYLHLEKSSVSRLIANLETKGWLERFPDENDGRIKRLRLTKQGKNIHAQLVKAREEKFSALLSHIPKSKHQEVNHALLLLIEACEQTLLEEHHA